MRGVDRATRRSIPGQVELSGTAYLSSHRSVEGYPGAQGGETSFCNRLYLRFYICLYISDLLLPSRPAAASTIQAPTGPSTPAINRTRNVDAMWNGRFTITVLRQVAQSSPPLATLPSVALFCQRAAQCRELGRPHRAAGKAQSGHTGG